MGNVVLLVLVLLVANCTEEVGAFGNETFVGVLHYLTH